MDKNLNRHKQANILMYVAIAVIVSVVIMGFMGLVTSEFNLALAAIFAYLGNHTLQNYRTKPDA